MIRKYLIAQYINLGSKVSIFGHDASIHLKAVGKTFLMLLGVWLLATIMFYLRGASEIIQWILSGMTVFVYFHFLLEFLNNYLDALISSERGITIFRRDGLLQYSVQQFERSSIEMISFEQDSFSDKMRHKGDIIINLDHGVSFRIEQITNPQKVVNILRSQKGERKSKEPPKAQEYHTDSEDKLAILVETLGEVIKDYIDKGQYPRLQ